MVNGSGAYHQAITDQSCWRSRCRSPEDHGKARPTASLSLGLPRQSDVPHVTHYPLSFLLLLSRSFAISSPDSSPLTTSSRTPLLTAVRLFVQGEDLIRIRDALRESAAHHHRVSSISRAGDRDTAERGRSKPPTTDGRREAGGPKVARGGCERGITAAAGGATTWSGFARHRAQRSRGDRGNAQQGGKGNCTSAGEKRRGGSRIDASAWSRRRVTSQRETAHRGAKGVSR